MTDDAPIERLNYFNGQQLAAADFRAEQQYHLTVRRLLNRSLYSPGVAAGLEVTVEPDQRTVLVAPGIALDDAGREIILRAPRRILAVGVPSEVPGVVYGNYLVIEYAEELGARVDDGCAVRPTGRGCRADDLAWGGPARLREEPRLRWRDTWPRAGSSQIVLAQVELDAQCKVARLNLGVRRTAALIQAGRTLAYGLEGEAAIDKDNPKRLIFHIRGGRPNSVTLYLHSLPFPALFYTELGRHTHAPTTTVAPAGAAGGHDHALGAIETDEAGSHTHTVTANTEDDGGGLERDPADNANTNLTADVGMNVLSAGAHKHTIAAGKRTDPAGAVAEHTHSVTVTLAPSGVSVPARSGAPYTYLENLRIIIDGQDFTSAVLAFLGWTELGVTSAGSTHPFAGPAGTGPVPLEQLGVDLTAGAHTIELKVPNSSGGRVSYNLYVE